MIGKLRNSIIVLFVIGILTSGIFSSLIVVTVFAQDEEEIAQEDIVYTQYELVTWLENHLDTGGDVYFGDKITIDADFYVGESGPAQHYTLHTQEFGVTYDGGTINLYDFEIVGEGVDVPVVTIINTGGWQPNWNHVAAELNVTSTGKGEIGGTALYIAQDDGSVFDTAHTIYPGVIRSYGVGAVGIELAVPLYTYSFTVIVEGENSSAIYAPNGANLFYCKLTATGQGAAVVSGSDLSLNTCVCSPEPQNATIINRKINDVARYEFYTHIPFSSEGKNSNDGLSFVFNFLLDEGDGFGVLRPFEVDWEQELKSVDTSVLGKTTIKGSLKPAYKGLGLENDFPIEMVVEVYDPIVPCLSDSYVKNILNDDDETVGKMIYLLYWQWPEIQGELSLKRSDDEGDSWQDITNSEQVSWVFNTARVSQTEILSPIMFRLEALENGVSNVVNIRPYDYRPALYNGDRDGGDRNGGNRFPISARNKPDPIPKPEEEKNPETENHPKPETEIKGDDNVNKEGKADKIDEVYNVFANQAETNAPLLIEETNAVTPVLVVEETNAVAPVSVAEETNAVAPIEVEEEANALDEPISAPKEFEDENTIAISAKRLEALIEANPENITFVKQGVQLSVETEKLRQLELEENQMLRVTVEKLPENEFSTLLMVDNTEVDDLPIQVTVLPVAKNDNSNSAKPVLIGTVAIIAVSAILGRKRILTRFFCKRPSSKSQ